MKKDLSDSWLRALRPPAEDRLEVVDTKTPGLVFRLTKSGSASWYFRGRTKDGRATRVKLGDYPSVGLADARGAAKDAAADLRKGGDPVAERRAARAARLAQEAAREEQAAETVAARLQQWQAARTSDPASPWSPRYAAEIQRVCRQAIIPKLGEKHLGSTTRVEWTTLVTDWKAAVAKPKAKRKGEKKRAGAPARDGSGAAAFLYRTVSAFLNHAEAHGWIDAPMLPRKGASLIAAAPAARARVLTDAELKAVWEAADREPPKLRAVIRLLILTAAREAEVAGMAVREVDREAARWRIPAERAKNRTSITVPLSPLALAEVAAVWPKEAEPDQFLFGRTAAAAFQGFGRLKKRIDAASKVAAWRWHDLRRTARTGMTRLGVPRDHAEAAINHISGRSKLERTYDRHDYAEEVVAALTRWQAHVAGLVGQGAKVVSLVERRRQK